MQSLWRDLLRSLQIFVYLNVINCIFMKWNRLFNCNIPLRKCDPITSALGDVGLGVASVVGNVLTNKSNKDFAQEMWEKNNEYNSPKNQRKRLEEAGYNPYLLTTDSSSSGLSVQPSTPASQGLPSFGHPFSMAQELYQKGLQVQSNLELQHAEAMEKVYSTIMKAYQEGGQKFGDETMERLAPTLERLDFNNSPLGRRLDNYIRGLELDNINTDLDNKFKELENHWYEVLSSDKHNLNADTHQLNQDLHNQYVETLAKIKAEIKEINSRADLNKAQKEKIMAERVGVIINNGLSALDYENKKTLQKEIQDITRETLSNLQEDVNLKTSQTRYYFESGKTQKHNRKHSKTQAGPFLFEFQGYGD